MRGLIPKHGKRPGCGIAFNLGCFVLFCCLLTGCRDSGTKSERPQSTPRTGGIYHIPLLKNPNGFDPIKAEDEYSTAVVYQLFDGLVRFSPDLLVIPALAESWQIGENGLVYRFLLRENALFQNGKPVTSQDVLFSLARLIKADPAPTILPYMLEILGADDYRAGRADDLAGVLVINEREIEIRLKEPFAPFLAALGMHQTRIVPREEVLKKGEQFAKAPVGSGPFSFVSWENNRSVRLKRFPEYFLGGAYLDEIEFIIYRGANFDEVLADFKEHKIQEMPAYDGKVRKQLLSIPDVKLMQRPSVSLQFYGMNCQNPVLRQPELRRALSLAIDRRRLASKAYEGRFELARSLIPPGILGYNPEILRIEDDFSKAREQMKKALPGNSGDALSLEIVSAVQTPFAMAELEFVADCWKEIGVTLKPKFIPDWREFERYIQSSSMQIYRYVWYMDIPDPDNIMQAIFGSDSKVNYMRYQNAEVDRELIAGRLVLEPAERAKIYQKIESIVERELPIIPLIHLSIDQAYQPNVNGVELNALGRHKTSFHRVWLSSGESK